MNRRIVKFFCALVGGFICLYATPAHAQDQSSAQAVVTSFKSSVDQGNTEGMLSIYGEIDESVPLKPENFEKMRPSMEHFVESWQNSIFVVDSIQVHGEDSQVVFVTSTSTSELLKFYTRLYSDKWFISDLEIYSLYQ